ncbi:hypothetical protein B0H14DRAFT_2597474 [Mycena olivaceomarginata]|nr:hypothetical protein B0H14DRAFT_2597474 [Mycena olivaceomarginata]
MGNRTVYGWASLLPSLVFLCLAALDSNQDLLHRTFVFVNSSFEVHPGQPDEKTTKRSELGVIRMLQRDCPLPMRSYAAARIQQPDSEREISLQGWERKSVDYYNKSKLTAKTAHAPALEPAPHPIRMRGARTRTYSNPAPAPQVRATAPLADNASTSTNTGAGLGISGNNLAPISLGYRKLTHQTGSKISKHLQHHPPRIGLEKAQLLLTQCPYYQA